MSRVKIFVLVLCLALGCLMSAGAFVLGWNQGRAPLKVLLAELSASYAKGKRLAAERAISDLQAAQARSDALSAGLLHQQATIDQLKTEARRAIPQVTTGRPCLGPAALRVLDGAPGLDVAGLPPAAGGAAAEGGPVATDTDIAGWAVDAGAAYEVCRARFDALIDWHSPVPVLNPAP
jgi:prophage endopeptidase